MRIVSVNQISEYLDEDLFPIFVTNPAETWIAECTGSYEGKESYSDKFVKSFESADFYEQCLEKTVGKLDWEQWSSCSKSCDGGIKFKIANSCKPQGAVCKAIQVQQEPCNTKTCKCNDGLIESNNVCYDLRDFVRENEKVRS